MSFFIMLLMYAAMTVLSDLLSPKPELENAKPAGLGDFNFPTATEQRKVPLLWGTVRISGANVVWWGNLVQEAVTEKIKTGLFSSERIIVGFRYHIGIQQALCEGPVDDMLRVWVDEDIVFDAVNGADTPVVHDGLFTINRPELFGGEDLGSGGFVGTFRFHAGQPLQNVSSYLAGFQKYPPVTGDTPAYRGFCYTAPYVGNAYIGTSTSVKPMKWEVRRQPNGLSLSGNMHQVNTYDANIMNVVYEVMTNTDWGYGIDASEIDVSNFTAAATTLFDEGNGFSMLIDRDEDTGQLISRLEQQADMGLFQNPFTGKWQAKLARDDYDINAAFELNVDNVLEVVSFTQSTWEDTKNQVSVPFNQRDDSYKGTYGFAQDMANVRIVGKKVPTQITHPGCNNKTLANSLAWRGLRTISQPLISMTAIVDRSAYGQLPGTVVAFTDQDYKAQKLPMRIQSIDYGSLFKGEIRMTLIQDVFRAAAGSFLDPPSTGWNPTSDTLVPFPAAEQLAIEAPRALTLRDPFTSSPTADKVFCSARRQGPEVSYRIRTRNHPTLPSGAYSINGQTFAFVRVGELQSTLTEDDAYPAASITVVPSPDTQASIANAFPAVVDIVELGTELNSLLYVDGEFMLVTSVSTGGGNVILNNVYRGVLDSFQKPHAAATDVFLIFVGSGMADGSFPAGDLVDVKLTPRSSSNEVAEASAVTMQVQLDNRVRRPYPPSEFDLNGTRLDLTSVDLDGSGSGESAGVTWANINRRDFRAVDEILQLSNDASVLATDFPAANSTTHSLVVKNGATVLVIQGIGSGTGGTVTQLDILHALNTTSLPASLTFGVRASHTFESTVYTSMVDCEVASTIVSDMIGQWAFGALDTNDVGALYEVQSRDDSTDHVFTLSSSFTAGNVEYRLDGGSWTTLITAGGTTGSIPNALLSVGTDIEVRHLSTDSGAQKLCTMTVGGLTRGYAVLFV